MIDAKFLKQHKWALLGGAALIGVGFVIVHKAGAGSSSPLAIVAGLQQSNNAAASSLMASEAQSAVQLQQQQLQADTATRLQAIQAVTNMYDANAQAAAAHQASTDSITKANIAANAAVAISKNQTAVQSAQVAASEAAQTAYLQTVQNGQNNAFDASLIGAGLKAAPDLISAIAGLFS